MEKGCRHPTTKYFPYIKYTTNKHLIQLKCKVVVDIYEIKY